MPEGVYCESLGDHEMGAGMVKQMDNSMKKMIKDSENILTVDKLFERLEKLKTGGYGDLRIKCGDAFLHDDEIGIKYYPEGEGEVLFRGHLFHQPISEKVFTLKKDIENAINKFYGLHRTDEI